MTLRLAAAAALGAVLLTGCAGSPSPAEQSASAVASASADLAKSQADLVKATCDNMAGGGSPSALAKVYVDKGLDPDVETALYKIRQRIQAGCPQYATRP